jgi:Fe-S-cluster containining protein
MNDNSPIRLLDDSPVSDGQAVTPPQPGFIRRQVELPVRDDLLHVVLDVVEDSTVRLAEVVPVIRRIDDRIIRTCLAQAAEDDKEVFCRKGCQACCHSYLLLLSPAEMYYQMELLDRLEPPRAEGARQWFARHAAEIRRSGLLARLRDLGPDDRPMDMIEQWWNFQEGTTCPFLDVDEGICSIYEDRFICCREFHSLRPPADCARHETSRLAITPSLLDMPCDIEARLTGQPVGAISMPDLLLWYEIRTAEAARAWAAPLLADELLATLADTASQAQLLRASATVDRPPEP